MVYSGNLNAWRDAADKVRSLGLVLEVDRWYSVANIHEEVGLRILTESRAVVAAKVFSHWDEDVLLNEQTAWLTRCYNDLKDWK